MVRTRADAGSTRVAGAKAPRKSVGSTSSASSPSRSTGKNKYSGGNSHNPQPIPSWQKSVDSFFSQTPKDKPSNAKNEQNDDAQSSGSSIKSENISDDD
ncbi:PCNA-associated factor-like [Oratosquilla oratoria]|uniref:PCNA-associated factor-like n=1 Tax=Oratosquilla oratoria TaxID=337810 RepID=UPI003F75FEB6